MPFLHWLRKKSRNTEAEEKASAARQTAPERITVTETTSENSGQVTAPEAPSIEKHSDEKPITFSLNRESPNLPTSLAETPEQPRAQPLANPTEERESASTEGAGKGVEPPRGEYPVAETVSAPVLDQSERFEPHATPTVRATTASGKINLPGMAADPIEREIRLRIAPILSNLPPGLEHPPMRNLGETEAEIDLPLDVIESQLANGRVVVSAAMFCRALPDDLKPYFETIEPTAEIPIPLREIFTRLPPEAINLREDQEVDFQEPNIQTAFGEQAEEDAKRFGMPLDAPTSPGPGPIPDQAATPVPKEAGTPVPAASSAHGPRLNVSEQDVSAPARPVPKFSVRADSERLQAIFMTDEVLDLGKTIRMVADLPGLRGCLLNTTDGLRLAGNLEDPGREQAVSALMPELFQQARSRLASMRLGMLETITLFCDQDQLSTFIEDQLCLTVLHDNRPFKPGVREKIQAVIRELATLSRFEKEP